MGTPEVIEVLGSEGDDQFARSARTWLGDNSIAAVALGMALMTAAGYCVHRSWLFGWYQAAGIPEFAHAWSVQDVVMQGVTNLSVWLFGLLAVVLTGVGVYLEFAAFDWAERWFDRYLASRKKGRNGIDVDANDKPRKARGKLGAHVALCGLFVCGAALMYCLIALAVILFSGQPRKMGHAQYLEMQKAAEKTLVAATSADGASKVAADVEEAREYMLERYRYVRTTVGTGDAAQRNCGWLVLQNGEHMFLLTRSGPLFLSASGLGFSWAPTKIGEC